MWRVYIAPSCESASAAWGRLRTAVPPAVPRERNGSHVWNVIRFIHSESFLPPRALYTLPTRSTLGCPSG